MNLRKDPLTKEAAEFLLQVGTQFLMAKNLDSAYKSFSFALHLNPNLIPAAHNLGVVFTVSGQREGAVRMFGEACKMSSFKDILELSAYAESLRKMGRNSDVVGIVERMKKLDADNYLTHLQEGINYYELGLLDEAVAKMRDCLRVKPGDVLSGLNRTLISMTNGSWVDEWLNYEKFLTFGGNDGNPEKSKLKGVLQEQTWRGKAIDEDKVLLVVSDQGKGDVFQFCRYFREIKDLCRGRLWFYCQSELSELMRTVDGLDDVVEFKSVPSLDYEGIASLLGVLDVLKISPENCYRPAPYVHVSRLHEDLWSSRIPRGKNLRVGIVWAGDPAHGNDHNRSVPISFFDEAFEVSGVDFYSLQVGKAAKGVEKYDGRVVDLGVQFRDFSDTAAALMQMDILISVDTSVVHLAGAIGHKNVWVLLPNPPEWRWLRDRDDSPWYEGVRLFRQPFPRDWEDVKIRVANELYIASRLHKEGGTTS